MHPVRSIEFTREARKALKAMPRNMRELVLGKIDGLAADPLRAPNVKKLVGRPGYRLRVGDWRVIYTLDAGRLVVRVPDIGARGEVYQ